MGPIHRVAVLVLLLSGALPGQRYSFKEYGQDAGLTNLDVYCLMQDRIGFLWVGTENGLFRYDGRQFRAYAKAQGLPSAQIEALHETADGEIWVGTTQGLARLKGDTFETVRAGPGNVTHAIASDALGNLYVGTNRGLLVAPPGGPQGQTRVSPVYPRREEPHSAARLRNWRRIRRAGLVWLRVRPLSSGGRPRSAAGGV
jgi:ligand-binding sensor domain-containing protein